MSRRGRILWIVLGLAYLGLAAALALGLAPWSRGPVTVLDWEVAPGGRGTAFSVGGGTWVTARHVADGCARLLLRGPRGRALPARLTRADPAADLAVLSGPAGGPALAVAAPGLLDRGDGSPLLVGFAREGPVGVRLRRKGRRVFVGVADFAIDMETDIWDAGTERSLDGTSGGPILGPGGGVVGVHVAGSPVRQEAMSVTLVDLRALLDATGWVEVPETLGRSPEEDDRAFSARVLRSGAVVPVLCVPN